MIPMKYNTLTTKTERNVVYITLNRPQRLNSFDLQLGRELHHVLQEISKDTTLRAVILKGTGKGFCGGGDVKEMYAAENKSQFLRELTQAIHNCVIAMRTMEKPVIGAINGHAFGAGLSLALACDIIVAVQEAQFGTAFIGIGLAPGCGTQFFTKLVGYHKACEYILTSKTFTATDALALGIINKVVDTQNLDSSVEEFAEKFRVLPPIAVGKAKMLINTSYENTMIKHLELESLTAAASAASTDFTEGVTAFVEKRKPYFIGK
jgi:2-(1,2-epoxy-1,2-dihydrophenyl)acetyl-CoA isomerase